MKKVLLTGAFFVLTPILLSICLIYLSLLSYEKNKHKISFSSKNVAYAALPQTDNVISDSLAIDDSRVEIVSQFFIRYHSPLLPYAVDVVKFADEYGIDFRLVPAIGMQESNLCLKAPAGSHNCWGFGIYGKQVLSFDNYLQAIEAVTKNLALNYINAGLVTPEQIMTKHTPSNDGSWAKSIRQFMAELQ